MLPVSYALLNKAAATPARSLAQEEHVSLHERYEASGTLVAAQTQDAALPHI
jgi:hypothetical protein